MLKTFFITCLMVLIISNPVKANQRIQLGLTDTNTTNIEYEIISLNQHNSNHSFGVVVGIDDNILDQLYAINRRYLSHDVFSGLYFNSVIGLEEKKDETTLLVGINIGYKNLIKDFIFGFQYGLFYPFEYSLEDKTIIYLGYAW